LAKGRVTTPGGRPTHSRRTVVQPYLPCGANVHAHLLTHPTHHSNGRLISSAVFARPMPHLRNNVSPYPPLPSPPKMPFPWRIWTQSNTSFLGPTRHTTTRTACRCSQPLLQNSTSLGLTDRQTNQLNEHTTHYQQAAYAIQYVRRGLKTKVDYR